MAQTQSRHPAARVLKSATPQSGVVIRKHAPASHTVFSWSRMGGSGPGGFTELFVMPSLERADLVKEGAPSTMVNVISREMAITKDKFVRIIGLPKATVTRKIANKSDLSPDESERVVGIAKLIGQVEAMIQTSGSDTQGFKPAKWFGEWIAQPQPALGGRRPEELLDTSDGRDLVARLLDQMQSGAYA